MQTVDVIFGQPANLQDKLYIQARADTQLAEKRDEMGSFSVQGKVNSFYSPTTGADAASWVQNCYRGCTPVSLSDNSGKIINMHHLHP